MLHDISPPPPPPTKKIQYETLWVILIYLKDKFIRCRRYKLVLSDDLCLVDGLLFEFCHGIGHSTAIP